MLNLGLGTRHAVMYGALFLTIGVYLPFWPVWLSAQGMSAGQIGVLLAVGTWIKVLSNPVIAQFADRTSRIKLTMVGCAALSLLFFSGFAAAETFLTILIVQILVNTFHPALIPLTETRTMAAATAGHLDYGRVRVWGSLSFVLGTLGAGWLLTGRDPDLILILILGTLILTVLAAMYLPRDLPAIGTMSGRGLWQFLTDRRFLLFLGAISMLTASHAVYYGFSALHWRAAGLSETTIGWLWAEGVIAEVILFAFGGALATRLGPRGLMLAAAAGGLLRWGVLGLSTALPALLAVQFLHAATFGAAHLGAMHFLARTAPPGLATSAQALYSAVSGGLAIGLAILVSGWLYAELEGGAFLVMAALSALGGVLTLVLFRRGEPSELNRMP